MTNAMSFARVTRTPSAAAACSESLTARSAAPSGERSSQPHDHDRAGARGEREPVA